MVKPRLSIIPIALAVLFLLFYVPAAVAQKDADWLRTVTQEGFVIDVDRTSLVLGQDRVIGARFRTTLLREEPVPEKPTVMYLTRLDTIQFNLKAGQYRMFKSTLLDASARVVTSLTSDGADSWKPMRSRTGSRLFRAASQLAPFGTWNVLTYNYASGQPPAKDDPSELQSLVGTRITLELDRVQAGEQECRSPVFEPKTVSDKEFSERSGSPLKSLGITADKVDAIVLTCEGNNKFPPQTLILKLPGRRALILWEGVFFEIERPGNLFLP